MYEFVAAAFERRQAKGCVKAVWQHVEKLLVQQGEVHELETVLYLHDCFCRALGKSLKLNRDEDPGCRRINRKWKDYGYYQAIIPLITRHKINPFSFFTFAIEQRRRTRVPLRINNVASTAAVEHYKNYLRSNSYRVSTYANHPDYESQLYNQLDQDISSMVTLLLRKSTVSIGQPDLFLFSTYSKVLLMLGRHLEIELTDQEEIFSDDLLFSANFATRVKRKWNQILALHRSKVQGLDHQLRDGYFSVKIGEIVNLLTTLRL